MSEENRKFLVVLSYAMKRNETYEDILDKLSLKGIHTTDDKCAIFERYHGLVYGEAPTTNTKIWMKFLDWYSKSVPSQKAMICPMCLPRFMVGPGTYQQHSIKMENMKLCPKHDKMVAERIDQKMKYAIATKIMEEVNDGVCEDRK